MAEGNLSALLTPEELARSVTPSWWHRVAQAFLWRPLLQPEGREALIWTTGLDGSCDWFDLDRGRGGPSTKGGQVSSIPAAFTLTWRRANGTAMVATAEFDPDEALSAYETLAPLGPIELLIHPADMDTGIDLILRAGQSVYHFEGASTSAWEA